MEKETPSGKTFLKGYPVPNQQSAVAPDFHHIDRLAISNGVLNHEIFEIGFGTDIKTAKKYLLLFEGVGRIFNPGSGGTWLTVWGTYMHSEDLQNPSYLITQTENLYSKIDSQGRNRHFTAFFEEKDGAFVFRINMELQERVV
ncbi:MAG: hypothetical protein V4478_01675 [Patescibacteria group bacterium]